MNACVIVSYLLDGRCLHG